MATVELTNHDCIHLPLRSVDPSRPQLRIQFGNRPIPSLPPVPSLLPGTRDRSHTLRLPADLGRSASSRAGPILEWLSQSVPILFVSASRATPSAIFPMRDAEVQLRSRHKDENRLLLTLAGHRAG